MIGRRGREGWEEIEPAVVEEIGPAVVEEAGPAVMEEIGPAVVEEGWLRLAKAD